MKGWLILGYVVIAFCVFLYTCDSNVKKLSEIEQRVIQSRKSDSLLTIVEKKHQSIQDSIILESSKKDSIAQLKISALQKGYNAQRAIIKHLTTIRVDSVNQVVNNVPIVEYNALIEAGNKCDSTLTLERDRIAEKDTVINALNEKFESEKKLTESAQNKSNDFEALSLEYKKELNKVKKQNKVLKLALLIDTLLHLVH